MKSKSFPLKFSLLCICLALCVFSANAGDGPTSVVVGKTYKQSQPKGSTQYFNLTRVGDETNLSIYLTSEGDSYYRMFLSNEILPSNSSKITEYSSGTHFVLLDIEMDKIATSIEKSIYIGVDCASPNPCEYQLRVDHPDIRYTVGPNDKLYPATNKNGTDVTASFYLPKNDSVERIVFSVSRVFTDSKVTAPIQTFIDRDDIDLGENLPSLMTAWDSGLAFLVLKSNPLFCTDCKWMLRAIFKDPVVFLARTYGAIERIKPYIRLDDAAYPKTRNVYMIDLEEDKIDKNDSIVITFHFYEGSVTYFINPDVLPEKLEESVWNITSIGEETIRISPAEREKLGLKKKIYIVILANQPTSYSITYKKISPEGKTWIGGQTLLPERAVLTFVQDGEVQTYWYHTKCHSDAILSVFANTGNVHVAVINCQWTDDCHLTASNFKNLDSLQRLTYYSNTSKMWKSGNIDIKDTLPANPKLKPQDCHYAISILGASVNSSSGESSIELWVENPDSVTRLTEGKSFKSELLPFSKRQFVFHFVGDTASAEQVTFQVTPVSGRAESSLLFVPSAQINGSGNVTKKTSGWSIDIVREKDSPKLMGIYYLNVTAYEDSILFITPIVRRKGASNTTVYKPITIPSGVAMRQTIKKNEVAYFKFQPNFDKGFNGSITILLQPLKGRVKFYVNVNGKTLPTNASGHYTWKCDYDMLNIQSFYKDFDPKGTYQIAVYPEPYDRARQLYHDNYSFAITYFNTEEFLYLQDGFPFEFEVSAAEPKYFEFDYAPGDGDVVLTKNSLSDYEVYVSTDPEVMFPNQTKYTARTINTFSVVLYEAVLASACKFSNSTSKFESCVLYAAAYTNYTKPVKSNILLTKSRKSVEISDGISTFQPILSKLTYHFYHRVYSFENSLRVKAWSHNKKVQVYGRAKSYHPENHLALEVEQLLYPTDEYHDFKSRTSFMNNFEYKDEFTISSKDLKSHCNYDTENCVITFTVYPESVSSNALELSGQIKIEDHQEPPYFLLLVTSTQAKLTSHSPIYDYVAEGQVKYYEIFITESKCENCTLNVDLTSYTQSKPKIFLAKGSGSRPVLTDAEFSYSDLHAKFTKDDAAKFNKEFYGDWVIGVYGVKDTGYQIVATFDDNKEISILGGHPNEFSLDADEQVTFQYYLSEASSIEIRTSLEQGQVSVEASTFKSEKTRRDDSTASFQRSKLSDDTTVLVLSEESVKKLVPCYVSITIKASQNHTVGNLVVRHPNEFIVLVDGHVYSDSIAAGKKLYFSFQQIQKNGSTEWTYAKTYLDVVTFDGNISVNVFNLPDCSDLFRVANRTTQPGQHYFSFDVQNFKMVETEEPVKNIFIEVTANTFSKFSIVGGSDDKVVRLVDGAMHVEFLGADKEVKYVVPLPLPREEQLDEIKININLYNYGSSGVGILGDVLRGAYNNLPSILRVELVNNDRHRVGVDFTADYTSEKNVKGDYVVSQLLIIGKEALQQKMKQIQGLEALTPRSKLTLEFTLRNPTEYASKYAVFAQLVKPISLPVGGLHFARVSNQHSSIYEVYASKSGVLVLELIECYGQVRIEASSSVQRMKNDVWDLKVNEPTKEVLYGHLRVNRGTTYVKISVLSGLRTKANANEKVALYKFQTRLFEEHSVLPYSSFYMGKSGLVLWSMAPEDTSLVKLVWSDTRVDENENIFKDYDVEPIYHILVAKDTVSLETYSKCGVYIKDKEIDVNSGEVIESHRIHVARSADLGTFDANIKDERSYEFSLAEHPDGTYFGVIVARLTGYNHNANYSSWTIPLVYETVQIPIGLSGQQSRSAPGWVMMAVFVLSITVIIIALLLFRYYKRYKITKARLQFEMQDVRNIAQVTSEEAAEERAEAAQKEKHMALVEEPQK